MVPNQEEIQEVINTNAPWYQRIDLPYNLTTTDQPGSWLNDKAWDNAINGVSIADAARLRPIPKWNSIKNLIPDLTGKTVLEVGSNCGFFSFQFAKTASYVIGIDISEGWHKKSLLLKKLKSISNVDFYICDFFLLGGLEDLNAPANTPYTSDFFAPSGTNVQIKPNIVDVIFSSTVIDHVYFPFLFIYKMLMNARSCVMLDTPIIDSWQPGDKYNNKEYLRIGIPKDGSHHGFSATQSFWRSYFRRLNVKSDCISFNQYSENNMCIVVDTSRWKPLHLGA